MHSTKKRTNHRRYKKKGSRKINRSFRNDIPLWRQDDLFLERFIQELDGEGDQATREARRVELVEELRGRFLVINGTKQREDLNQEGEEEKRENGRETEPLKLEDDKGKKFKKNQKRKRQLSRDVFHQFLWETVDMWMLQKQWEVMSTFEHGEVLLPEEYLRKRYEVDEWVCERPLFEYCQKVMDVRRGRRNKRNIVRWDKNSVTFTGDMDRIHVTKVRLGELEDELWALGRAMQELEETVMRREGEKEEEEKEKRSNGSKRTLSDRSLDEIACKEDYEEFKLNVFRRNYCAFAKVMRELIQQVERQNNQEDDKKRKKKKRSKEKKPCRYFVEGNCRNGENCRYAHSTT